MKPELQRVAIPRGWRKLRVGEYIRNTDRVLRFEARAYTAPREGDVYWHSTGEKYAPVSTHQPRIRKTTARPRKGKARKVSKAGGRKGK